MENSYRLLGYPLGHTMSPPIHNALFSLYGQQADYRLFETPPEKLAETMPELKKLSGFNITIPHKVAVMQYLDRIEEKAALYGAVNLVKCGSENVGYNTDVIGFTKSVELLGASLCSRVLLLGCGGVGRMMAIETALQGGELTIAVIPEGLPAAQKAVEEIKQLKPSAQVEIVPIDRISGSYDLMINATPVGMYPHIDDSPVGEETVTAAPYLFDVIYNPIETKLMQAAKRHGVKALGGMAMLVLQAVAAHEIWNGAEYRNADIEALISEMERRLGSEK